MVMNDAKNDGDHLADMTEQEFNEWLATMSSVVSVNQLRVFKHIRLEALKRRTATATREEQRGRYLDSGPKAWDDRDSESGDF